MPEHSIRDVGFNLIFFPFVQYHPPKIYPDLPEKGDFRSRTSQETRGVGERKRSAVLIRNDLKAQGFKIERAGMEDDVHQRDMWGVSRYSVGWNSDQVAVWDVYGIWGNIC